MIIKLLKRYLKRWRTKRHIKRLAKLSSLHKFELIEFMIGEMKIEPGDTLFIHSSFSDLKMSCTADALIQMLIDYIGPEGNILMPFYPLKSSHEFLLEGKPFDLTKNRTSMGALVQAMAKREDVKKSIHPTKSVVVWGKDKWILTVDHGLDIYPYGPNSPYARIGIRDFSKIIGLGVTSDFLSCMHVAVDCMEHYPVNPYYKEVLTGTVITENGPVKVSTLSHNLMITNTEDVPRFLNSTDCPTYREYEFQGRDFFSVDANPLIFHVMEQAKSGRTFFY